MFIQIVYIRKLDARKSRHEIVLWTMSEGDTRARERMN